MNSFYYFAGETEKQMFMLNPLRFTNNIIFSSEKGIPLRLKPHKAAEVVLHQKGILGYCPVTLVDEERVAKGDPILVVQYKDKKFSFMNEEKLQKFIATPARYHRAELPVKMPPIEDPVSL
jgi:YHS domain-containing protein